MSAAESIHDGVNARRVGTCGNPDCGEAIYSDSDDDRACLEEHGQCAECTRAMFDREQVDAAAPPSVEPDVLEEMRGVLTHAVDAGAHCPCGACSFVRQDRTGDEAEAHHAAQVAALRKGLVLLGQVAL